MLTCATKLSNMKKVLLTLGAAVFATSGFSQITIQASDYTLPISPDTLNVRYLANTIPLPQAGSNQLWDFSNAQFVAGSFFISYEPSDKPSAFPNSAAMQRYNPGLGPISIQGSKSYYSADNQGHYYNGFITAQQSLSITAITGSPTDVLAFPGGPSDLGTGGKIIVFPLSNGTVNVTGYTGVTNFNLTVAGFGLNATPGELRQTSIKADTVIGWGRVILPGNDTVEVLLNKISETLIDSIYLAGAPAPDQLLTAFGLSQGGFITQNRYELIGKGFSGPVARFFTNDDFTTNDGTWVTAEKARGGTFIANDLSASVSVFPNPASQIVNLNWEKAKFNELRVVDLSGRVVLKTDVNSLYQTTIDVSGLKAGLYVLILQGNEGVATHKLNISK